MAWQRLFCVAVYALALASILEAKGALLVEGTSGAVEKEPAGKTNPVGAQDRVKRKVAIGKTKPGPAGPAHSEKRRTGQIGYASWYGGERHGRRTASGGHFDRNELTAAHRTLPLHSKARVTNMANGRAVTVSITDRGPMRKGRIIDLSQSAAEQLGMRHRGVARVEVEPVLAGQ